MAIQSTWTLLAALVTLVAVGCGHPNAAPGAAATGDGESHPVPTISGTTQAPETQPVADPKPATPVAAPVPPTEAPSKPTSFLDTKPLPATETYSGKTLSEWIASLGDNDEEIRVQAVNAVAQYGPNAKEVTPALVKILNDPRDRAFVNAFAAVRAIGPDAGGAVPRLVELLRHDHANTRSLAALTLRDLGPAAGKAVPALIDRLGDDELYSGSRVRDTAAVTLTKIGKYDIRAVFAAARSEKVSAYVLKWIVESLSADDEFAVDGLAEQLKREDVLTLTHAMGGLRRIGPKAAPALPALRTHAEGADNDLKDIAAKAISAIDASGKLAGPIKADDPSKVEAPLGLYTVLIKAGFDIKRDWTRHLAPYVRFGSKSAADKFLGGDQFDKIEVDKAAKDHRTAVAKLSFRITDLTYSPVVRDDIETEGLLAEVKLPMRVRGEKPFSDDPSGYSGVLSGLKPSEVDARRFSFLTKDGKLRVCTPAEAALVKRNEGVLYHPELANTTLILVFKGELDVLKRMARNATEFTVEIEFSKLRYERPRAWGYFRKDAYHEARWDCERLWGDYLNDEDAPQPIYFPTALAGENETKIPEIVQAQLNPLRVVGKDGKVIGGYHVK